MQNARFASGKAANATSRLHINARGIVGLLSILLVLFLSVYRLGDFPLTWFDEGSHLHVPKTLVRFGVYADYSSEGFRYYGPTIGVGPTVMLPIAAAFNVLGIGLLQARLVLALYLLGAILAFYGLARQYGDMRYAWVATALLISTRGIALIELGRQALGEVPGLFFMAGGFWLWLMCWGRASILRLIGVGLLLGLAMVTKYQYLLILGPTLLAIWLANLLYYRASPQRFFLIPGIVSGLTFATWQAYQVFYLGPSTASENLANFREFTSGAALVFSPELAKLALSQLLGPNVYMGLLLPCLFYGALLAVRRNAEGERQFLLVALVAFNLLWFVTASIGWLRYAFPGLVISALLVAQFFRDATGNFDLHPGLLRRVRVVDRDKLVQAAVRIALAGCLAIMIVLPLAMTISQVVRPTFNAPAAMSDYMNEHVPADALVETWEPEMGFLTDHNYHFPPAMLLNVAVAYRWLDGPEPAQAYGFVETERPAYILDGEFAKWVGLYAGVTNDADYVRETEIGSYTLFRRK